MKNVYLVAMFGVFGLGLYLGGMIEHRTHTLPALYRNHVLGKEVERFENYTVFSNAQDVARITGAPLYQVLTGKKVSQ